MVFVFFIRALSTAELIGNIWIRIAIAVNWPVQKSAQTCFSTFTVDAK